jgi:hypothetical protein
MQPPAAASGCKGCVLCAALMLECDRLTRELEAMHLKRFWMQHNHAQLKGAMQCANQDEAKGPNCACMACGLSGRVHPEQSPPGNRCSFKPYFEAALRECCLVHAKVQGKRVGEVGAHDAAANIYADDAQLVWVMRDDWRAFSYGAKLWRADSCEDAELAKLALLFRRLAAADV